ncbi:hypothetical protein BH708_11565 [Brachybacterium sp. P6-10-X1]|uniref:MarR family winged helix-turn-helix transcriptional regulator n=1 Tax=Brachybacterium sp. P6-10-X1 TaxID=1903186 RepID=UPI00097186D7|nr:MarR family winged helix-turn-helix transcriptional regulator [Brachybacterium sp. P6-10-X1]APX33244.1 hypothetical protein BH708_11565 [Brachybacterium sp. P6-10-X1]
MTRDGEGRTSGVGDGRIEEDDDRGRTTAALLTRLTRHQRLHRQQQVLGDADLRILWLFFDERPRTLREISDALHLEQSTVNRQVNAAVAAGLLERSRPEGGGAYVFARTEAGHDLFEADVASALDGYREALDALGEPEATEFLRLLARFSEAYRVVVEAAGRPRPRDGD